MSAGPKNKARGAEAATATRSEGPSVERSRRGSKKPARSKKSGRVAVAAAVTPDLPRFAAAFPDDERLMRVVAVFELGDYASVRRLADPLTRAPEPAEVRAAARELLRRTRPDPLAVALTSAPVVLLAFLALYYLATATP